MTAYDHPFYKQLRKNDLSQGKGKQGGKQAGPLIPKGLLQYLPPLEPQGFEPTAETYLRLDLFDGQDAVGTIDCRYQYQTWDHKRDPEFRLTQKIVPRLLRNAREDDFLMFERQSDATDRYRVTLVRAGTLQHSAMASQSRGRRWGPLGEPPYPLSEIQDHESDILTSATTPFRAFDTRHYGQTQRLLRSAAFRRVVYRAYDWSCAVCATGLVVPVDDFEHQPPVEPEAAHIIPLAANGGDDVRNGLCLCRRHHWSFDHGLIWVDGNRRWRVSALAKKEPRNHPLLEDDGLHLSEPQDKSLAADGYALEWHRTRVAIA